MTMHNFIAERHLLFSGKGEALKKELVIRIGEPYQLKEGEVSFDVSDGVFGCHVQVDGIDENYTEVYGADSIQALNLATNLEPFLKRMQKKYDLYWSSGDPYFE